MDLTNTNKKLRVIVTGATGFVGEGVLLECLEHPSIEQVLMVNRRPSSLSHPKLRECVVEDFGDISRYAEQVGGYDACFYCAGISSRGMNEASYSHIIFDLTLSFAEVVQALNPGMTFCYVSGNLTDSSERGRIMWARVKGKTENALLKLKGLNVYNFRPGFMKPTPGQQNIKTYYKLIGSLYPFLKLTFPNTVSTMAEVGTAMIEVSLQGSPKRVLEIADIKIAAKAPQSRVNS